LDSIVVGSVGTLIKDGWLCASFLLFFPWTISSQFNFLKADFGLQNFDVVLTIFGRSKKNKWQY